MRILLDENVPVQLRARLAPHEAVSINEPALGWKGTKNGVLLERMEGRFDVLVTADQNIYAQQNLKGREFSIIVLPTNRRRLVLALTEVILDTLARIEKGEYVALPPK